MHDRLIGTTVGAMILSLVLAASSDAQETGSLQKEKATFSLGAGTAILTLPDVPSFVSLAGVTAPSSFQTGTFELSNGFDDEVGANISASLNLPLADNSKTLALSGFWSTIEGKTTSTCLDGDFNNLCMFAPLVDNPNTAQRSLTAAIGETITTTTKREVEHWGASIEAQLQLPSDISGVTRTPPRRHVAVGADIRGIHQNLDVEIINTRPGFTPASYDEKLNATYYGIYASWGRDYTLPFFGQITRGLGLQSSFKVRGGVYYADTDYEGSLVDGTSALQQATGALSLSRDDVAFIGGLVLETTKRIGKRAALTLKSEYDYYSYVPAMAYNQVDASNLGVTAIGGQSGTVIKDDDAFSARSTLRLTIGLGPDELHR